MFEFSGFGGERRSGVGTELPIVLRTCVECHNGAGIYSINSFTRRLSLEVPPTETPQMVEADVHSDESGFFSNKEITFQWGLLQGLWMQNN